jgi:LacI family transcriptional regulator
MIAKDSLPVSIKAVAARAGVSIATVSRVINGVAKKASAETIARVRKAAAELDYRPISAGRALRNRQTHMVAVLASNLANPTMTAIATSAEAALRRAGFVMVLCDTHDTADLQDEYLREMRARQAHAIVLLGAVDSAQLRVVASSDMRIVFVNRRHPLGWPSSFIGIDNAAAAVELADTCMENGYRRVAIVHASKASSATQERVDAMCARFRELGRPVSANMILTADSTDHLRIGLESGLRLSGRRAPDAVVAMSDLIAFGVHRALAETGVVTFPRIFGFDDNPLNDWIAPWLSSVRIPYSDFGPAIVDAVRDELSEGRARTRILPHTLVLREGRRDPAGADRR